MRTGVDLDDERADERDVAVVHGWLHEHGVDLILGGRCRFGRGWLV
jgi:hypothetical protein